MKKILLSFIVVLLLVSTAGAQSHYKTLSWGVKAGLNVTSVTDAVDKIGSSQTKYVLGLFLEFRPVKFLGISAELNYSGQGFSADGTYTPAGTTLNIPYTSRYDLGYLEVPILANVYLWRGLALKAGIQYGSLISSRVNVFGADIDKPTNFNKSNVSIPVGIGYSFGFGLLLDVRYNFGLSDINRGLFDAGNITAHSQVFTVSAGFRF